MIDRLGRRSAVLLGVVALIAACGPPGGGATNPPATTPAAATSPATTSAAGLTLEVRQDSTLGALVAGKDGMSLYVFTVDSGGTSACVDECATTWPPLTVASASDVAAGAGVTGAISTIKRADGSNQVTLGGSPLYYFKNDTAAGDMNGQGTNDVWYLASPAGVPVKGGGTDASPGPGATPGESECGGRYCY